MTHNYMYIKTNISKHFTQEQISLPTSGRDIPCCHLSRPLKESVYVWHFLWLSCMHWCNSNCFCSSINIQGRKFVTIYHKFNLVSKFDGINQKVAQLISQIVDNNTSTFMPNSVNMLHISVHVHCRQASWIFSILDRCHSISVLCWTIKYYSLPHCFLSESQC